MSRPASTTDRYEYGPPWFLWIALAAYLGVVIGLAARWVAA